MAADRWTRTRNKKQTSLNLIGTVWIMKALGLGSYLRVKEIGA